MTTIATAWLTQHAQGRAQRHADRVARRERFYGTFIDEASTLYTDALTHDRIDPSKFVRIYATVGKLRLFATADVVSKADAVVKEISDIYYLPNRDFSQHEIAPETELKTLRAFSEACRNELVG